MVMSRIAFYLTSLALFATCMAHPAAAQLFETKAKTAFMIDAQTGTVLFEKDADTPIPPASLAKLMTVEIVFHAIKSGSRSMTDTFKVSENAWRTGGASSGGSTMFAKLDSVISLQDLVRAVIVQSANDACIIIAEGYAGSEDSFATLMNERAKELGMTKSIFKNSTGLPAAGQQVTMREMAILAKDIWQQYPENYKIFAEPEFTWNKILQRNRNPLLTMDIGADGMKTGFTEETGYAIVGSVERNGMRVFVAMSGMASERERAEESRKLLDWGATAFTRVAIYAKDEAMGEASVFGGAASSVAIGAPEDVAVLIPTANKDKLKARISYLGPITAPIEKGQRIGTLKVYIGEALTQETQLIALADVPEGTLFQRATSAVKELATGWIRSL